MAQETLRLRLYRNLANRAAGQPDDGPMAWEAHRARLDFLRELDAEDAFDIRDWDVADDAERPHELAEIVVAVLADPGLAAVAGGAAAYAGRIVAARIDAALGGVVASLIDRLVGGFRGRRVGEFELELPDGSTLRMDTDETVTITLRDGKPIRVTVEGKPGPDEV
jgi:hypothetical protein